MVSQNEEQGQVTGAEAPPDQPMEPAPDQGNPILSEIDRLNSAGDSPPVAEAPAPAPASEPDPAPATPGLATEPKQPTAEEIMGLQRQAAEYEELRQKAAIQQGAQNYRNQLEMQGYSSEQAETTTNQYVQSQQAQQDLMKRADEYGNHLIGKQAAAEHFAQKYNLQMNDLTRLRQSETPEDMEQVAKNLADDRKVRDELTQLRAAQVPAQQFDNSQGSPEVAASEGSWLDRYNSGDRSANAVAAARRAAGLE